MSTSRAIQDALVRVVQRELRQRQDSGKALSMQAYLKTEMPMYGVQKPERAKVEKIMHDHLGVAVDSLEAYQECVRTLWDLPHREEKYLAIDLALKYKTYISIDSLDLYESMIREDYMWWDFCDPISVNLVGKVALIHDLEPKLRQWIRDDNMWIRRAAILAHLKHKQKMNAQAMFDFCRQRMHEKEFYIRKAIGWVLREYSKTDPAAVITFLNQEKEHLSGLSYREGARILVQRRMM